nr:immunoglobulin heavy chain junction region [Macaca mulatta]
CANGRWLGIDYW